MDDSSLSAALRTCLDPICTALPPECGREAQHLLPDYLKSVHIIPLNEIHVQP